MSKEDQKQPFVGTIELVEALTVQSASLRYPLTSKLLDAISDGNYGDAITFHDVLSEKDLQVVTSMVKNRDDLEWLYVPVSGENADDPHNRKLRIVRKVKSNDTAGGEQQFESEGFYFVGGKRQSENQAYDNTSNYTYATHSDALRLNHRAPRHRLSPSAALASRAPAKEGPAACLGEASQPEAPRGQS